MSDQPDTASSADLLTKPLARFDIAHMVERLRADRHPLASGEAFDMADAILAHLERGGWRAPE